MPVRKVGGGVEDAEAVQRAETITFEPPPAYGPGQTYKDGVVRAKFKAYIPTVSVGGVAQEGQDLTATVSFPRLPPGHPPVSLRVLVTWLREDIGKYWLTDGDAIARSQLRQRGVYEPNNFIPSVDLRPPEQRRYTVIEGETRINYNLRMEDVGRRVGLKVQPISATGQLGEIYTAWSSEILLSFPHCRSLTLHDTVTRSALSIRAARVPAAEMLPEAGAHVVFPVVGHTVRADYSYIGGEAGEHSLKWWRLPPPPAEPQLVAIQTDMYTVQPEDNECQLRVEFVPVRIDGTQGCAREVFTGMISSKCFFSSTEHKHTHGFCPFELSQNDLLAKGIPPPNLEPPRTAGIGLVLRENQFGVHEVRHMLPGMPAAESKQIRKGDLLVAVDDQPLLGKQIADVIPGPEGSTVRLTFEREKREGDPKDFQTRFEVELMRSSPENTISRPERQGDPPPHATLNATFESVLEGGKSGFSELGSILDPLGAAYSPPPRVR